MRQTQFDLIKKNFSDQIQPQMQTQIYARFAEAPINNAFLQQNAIYYADMTQYLALHESLGGNLKATYSFLKSLEESKTPEEDLSSKFAELSLP